MAEALILERLRAAAVHHGPGWLEETVAALTRIPDAVSPRRARRSGSVVRDRLPSPGPLTSMAMAAGGESATTAPALGRQRAVPGVTAMRAVSTRPSRRSRPPERLSPEVVPRTRRRRGSPIPDAAGQAAGRTAPSQALRPGRNPRPRRGPAVSRESQAGLPVTPPPSDGRCREQGTAAPHGDVPARGQASSGSSRRTTRSAATSRQQVRSEVWVPAVGRQVAGPSVSASSSPFRRCRWEGQSSAREELEEGELDVYRRGQDGPADGNTAPVQPVSESPPCLVWLMGHSYVHWGALRADVRPNGRQLRIPRQDAVVHWLGFRGMSWSRVLAEFQTYARLDRVPEVLVLHVGGNDLGVRPFRELVRDTKHDMLCLWVSYPKLVIVWSDIVPRKHWRLARSVERVNKARIKVNRAVSRFVAKNGGICVRHRDLESGVGNFWRSDGVHLTERIIEFQDHSP
ncbi:uncharacterized protein LOC142750560 [Rhinoderma darwinii]|uniref:uncharacterized protein LOC142750560 n=1 Tax=Rhinoderma darwinii TaxID=43563 RepID=UPI003F66EBA0